MDFTLANCFFGPVKLIKNADLDKYKYTRHRRYLNFWWRTNTILDHTTLTLELKYPINFTQSGKRFVLSPHYNGSNSYLIVNATNVYQFKAKDSEIKDYALCLGNVSKDFTINNMKRNRIKRS